MCGEDGIKRAVYNMKRGHAGRGSKDREKNKEKTQKETWREKELYLPKRKTDCCSSSEPSIHVRANLFILQKLI